MKKAIRYLRFSQLGKVMVPIERQELYTDQYNCNITTYNWLILSSDRGKSAKNFDRPDFHKITGLHSQTL